MPRWSRLAASLAAQLLEPSDPTSCSVTSFLDEQREAAEAVSPCNAVAFAHEGC
jgi:hypothetical protein